MSYFTENFFPPTYFGGLDGSDLIVGDYSTDLTQTTVSPSLTIPIGVDGSWLVTLMDNAQGPPIGFTTGFTPSATVWAGGASPILFQPDVSWINPEEGILDLVIPASMTSGLVAAKYKLRITIGTPDGKTLAAPDFSLKLTASPESAATLTTYCSFSDLLLYAPWLEDQDDGDTDESGYLKQRAQARAHFDRIVLSHVPATQSFAGFGTFASLLTYNEGTNPYVFGLLNSDKLVVTPQVVEINARHAIGLIADSMVSPKEDKSGYQQIAARMFAMSNALMTGYIAEFDVIGTGNPPYFPIPCNRFSTRVPTPRFSGWGCC